jgi:hypothetical protein
VRKIVKLSILHFAAASWAVDANGIVDKSGCNESERERERHLQPKALNNAEL